MLEGRGIEIGPGHVPFPGVAAAKVRYIDRWAAGENRSLFPELGDGVVFPEPDIKADLDVDRLRAVRSRSQDFVIACHILEHLANPLAMLKEIDRVLRPGGKAVVVLPDREHTVDRTRAPTSLDHLVDELHGDVHEVSREHLVEAVAAQVYKMRADRRPLEEIGADLGEDELEMHRQRSVHVHVWTQAEFTEVVRYARSELGLRWDVLETMDTGRDGTYGDEFGWLFLKAPEPDRASRWRMLFDVLAGRE